MTFLVYGARGFLGRMVVERLRARGHSLRLSSRDPDRLPIGVGEESVHSDDPALVEGVQVVVNCAPLSLPETQGLIARCRAAGSHYVDAAGEQALIGAVLAGADEAGPAVVPALGLDYAVGDCLARLAGPCEELVVAYSFQGGQAAANSLRFATGARRGREMVYRRGRWKPVPWELDRASFDFGPPLGRQRMGRYGSGEVVMVPRHTRVETIRTWITAASLVPHPALLPIFPLLRPLAAWLLQTPARGLLAIVGGILGRLRRQPPAQDNLTGGPSFTIVVESRSGGRTLARLEARGEDCHRTTAEILCLGAEWLAGGRGAGGGGRTPAEAFEPELFLNAVTSLRWSWIHGRPFGKNAGNHSR